MLTLRHVTKRFASLVAVDDLSLEVKRGEVFGLLGPNGAGKTTTVSIAAGLLAADTGEALVEGAGSPTRPAARRAVGLAPQTLSLYDDLTARENLMFFARLYGLGGVAREERTRWALDFVGLADRQRDRVQTFSGGMKRRLNLACALVHDPDLVMLDEPTAGVDPQSRNAILDNIVALKASGRAVLYTTHYMEEAARLCDRVAIVDHGKLLALDTVDGLVTTYGGDPVLVVRADGEPIRLATGDPLAALNLIASKRRLDDFHVERATLETVFLNLTGRALRD